LILFIYLLNLIYLTTRILFIYLILGFKTFLVLIFVVFVADGPHFDRIFKMVLIFTECLK